MQNIGQCIGTAGALPALTVTASKPENQVPLTLIQCSINGKTRAMQLYISSKEPVQPKYQIRFGVGTVHRVCRG